MTEVATGLWPAVLVAAVAFALLTAAMAWRWWTRPPSPRDALLAKMASTRSMSRAGVLTPEQVAALVGVATSSDPIAAAERLFPAASGVYRADLYAAVAREHGRRTDTRAAVEAWAMATSLVPTDPAFAAALAGACAKAGDHGGFVAAAAAWRGLAGLDTVDRGRVDRWLRELSADPP